MLYTFFIATTVDFVTHFIYKIHDKEVLCVCVYARNPTDANILPCFEYEYKILLLSFTRNSTTEYYSKISFTVWIDLNEYLTNYPTLSSLSHKSPNFHFRK